MIPQTNLGRLPLSHQKSVLNRLARRVPMQCVSSNREHRFLGLLSPIDGPTHFEATAR